MNDLGFYRGYPTFLGKNIGNQQVRYLILGAGSNRDPCWKLLVLSFLRPVTMPAT